jgi:adenosylmethionine-8-amino-7-oxononanoate aminotransferase
MTSTKQLRDRDKQHLWHPFTQAEDWCAPDHEPLILVEGKGALLRDAEGNEYLDGNSSIWTNIHGHRHPHIDAALHTQIDQLAHCSALGFSNRPSIELATKLVSLFPEDSLSRVFFTDDGSTAIECACKMSLQYRQLCGETERSKFISFDRAYHGDTSGAASLGGIGTFQNRFTGSGFDVLSIPDLESLTALAPHEIEKINALCIEPLIQGAAGMKLWPKGMLAKLRAWCDQHGVLLILDEVMTGFGRTGKMFACEHESVIPDFLCLAKGLTGGYLPLAATLTNKTIFDAFRGGYQETFFYGHSYCGNPLGCAAALASLEIFESEQVIKNLPTKIACFSEALRERFSENKNVSEIRQLGLIAGIDVMPPDPDQYIGEQICVSARKHGLLTRAIRNTLVLMPPLCSSEEQIRSMVNALASGLVDEGR